MAYVYRHIRLDKHEPFYIGIGTDKTYCRANNTIKRNKIWKAIISKTEYQIEILMEGLSWEEACKKEVEFIKLYGRINLKNGSLCNLTDGGDGSVGYIASEEAKLKIGEKSKGRIKSPEQIEKWKNKMNFEKSSEVRDKIRQSLLGKTHSEERKHKSSLSHIGKVMSEEAKQKLSNSLKGIKKPPFTEEHIQRLRDSHKKSKTI